MLHDEMLDGSLLLVHYLRHVFSYVQDLQLESIGTDHSRLQVNEAGLIVYFLGHPSLGMRNWFPVFSSSPSKNL